MEQSLSVCMSVTTPPRFLIKPHDVIYFCDPLTCGKKVVRFNFGFMTKIFFRKFAALKPRPSWGLIPARAS